LCVCVRGGGGRKNRETERADRPRATNSYKQKASGLQKNGRGKLKLFGRKTE
jgi:hypothetical protein